MYHCEVQHYFKMLQMPKPRALQYRKVIMIRCPSQIPTRLQNFSFTFFLVYDYLMVATLQFHWLPNYFWICARLMQKYSDVCIWCFHVCIGIPLSLRISPYCISLCYHHPGYAASAQDVKFCASLSYSSVKLSVHHLDFEMVGNGDFWPIQTVLRIAN